MSNEYPLVMSDSEIARLRMQADLFRRDADHMLLEIGVRPGWRCLDLCCGVGGITDLLSQHVGSSGDVVGLDFDAAKLDVAKEWARTNGFTNVRYVHADAFATGLPSESFDLVHTRFAISIVPNGLGMLDHILELVRPGGVLFLEEVEFGSVACHPGHPAWNRAASAIFTCFKQIGSDLNLGRKLNAVLTEAGVEVVRLKPCHYALRAGEPMNYHIPLTLDAMRESVTQLGLMDEAELEETVAAVNAHVSKPQTMTVSFTTMQAVGRVSKR